LSRATRGISYFAYCDSPAFSVKMMLFEDKKRRTNSMLKTFLSHQWNEHFPDSTQQQAIGSLESGQILYFPELAFTLTPEEQMFLSPDYADTHAKNISYHSERNKLWGVRNLDDVQQIQLKLMLDRYS